MSRRLDGTVMGFDEKTQIVKTNPDVWLNPKILVRQTCQQNI